VKNCFDLSVESVTMKNNEQIGGYLPGDYESESPYPYVNPYPFDEKMVETCHWPQVNDIQLVGAELK